MADKSPSKVDQVRALREARANRKPNKFEDAARGRDPAPASDGKVKLQDRKKISPHHGATERKDSGESEGPRAVPVMKRGRPRIGETRDKPWIALGMSERTYYRRQAGKKS